MAADTHLPDGAPDRRAVLRGISAMGLAAFTVPLAIGSEAGAATVAPESTLDPKPPKKKGKKAAKLVKASDTPLATTDTIPVNSGYLLEADEYIVTQPKAGKFVGFDSLCTHEGCPVDVFDRPGIMACSCHSTDFDIATGKVLSGPAKKPMPKKPIIVEGNNIYKAKPAK